MLALILSAFFIACSFLLLWSAWNRRRRFKKVKSSLNGWETSTLLDNLGPPRWNTKSSCWEITRMEDMKRISNHSAISANYLPSFIANSKKLFSQDYNFEERYQPVIDFFSKWVLFMDGREHTSLYRLLYSFFTSSKVAKMRPLIRKQVQTFLQKCLRKQPLHTDKEAQRYSSSLQIDNTKTIDESFTIQGERKEKVYEWDLMKDMAHALPLHIIMNILGLPHSEADTHRMKGWADTVENWFGGEQADVIARWDNCLNVINAYHSYMRSLLDEHKRNTSNEESKINSYEPDLNVPFFFRPGCVIADMLQLVESGMLDQSVMLANIFFLVAAAHETTSSLIANGWLVLLQHPQQLQLLRSKVCQTDDQAISDSALTSAIDELLRYVSPIKRMYREVKEDFIYKDLKFRKGQMVHLLNTTGNLDDLVYKNALELDLCRQNTKQNKHIAFGYGQHTCIGSKLARLEAEVVLFELLKIPTIGLNVQTTDLCWAKLESLNSLAALPVYAILDEKAISSQ
jgi:cytochrome P450